VSPRRDTKGPVDRPEPTDPGRPAGGPLGSVLREVLGEAALRGGVALGRLVRRWEAVVGPDLARRTTPRGLRDGVLVVASASQPWAVQVRFLAAEIVRAANAELGSEATREVRVVVDPEAWKALPHKGSHGDAEPPDGGFRGPSSDRI
jgi:predicted nucleic acid-binding Zn ribbon protein